MSGLYARLALMMSADPLPQSRWRAWRRRQCHGLWDQTALFASPLGHPRFFCSPWLL